MTTDTGIDLVAYSNKNQKAVTIQVKTCLQSKPAGGKGQPALDWWLRESSPAELVALVDLSTEKVWLFEHSTFVEKCQQNPSGRLHLYFYTDPAYQARVGCREKDFVDFRIKKAAPLLLG